MEKLFLLGITAQNIFSQAINQSDICPDPTTGTECALNSNVAANLPDYVRSLGTETVVILLGFGLIFGGASIYQTITNSRK